MYNNRYYADFVYRLSGSSKFGSNQRYGQFWSGGLGWNLHNENFLKFEKLNLLKIRGSVGYTGKVNFEPFQSITMYKYENTLEYLHGIGAIPQTIGNDDLKWEAGIFLQYRCRYQPFRSQVERHPRFLSQKDERLSAGCQYRSVYRGGQW